MNEEPPLLTDESSKEPAEQPSTSNPVPTATPKPIPRPSSLPKPSGLKPPSKIGRLCANSTLKPAVPASPRSDGSTTDSVRKLSDELSRKHLSDLIEAEEDEVSSSLPDRPRMHRKASTSSTYSITSMDALWEKHPRRLSEAGLRRSSDHSVVLTEDTDSFIIGERVWVGGGKPGQIAYIGETQFAPGDWAGIVLDESIGKNDGSVAGIRYFQCADKRGVFSRLTRLTRSPLVQHDASPCSDAGSVFERPPSGMAKPRRTLSPNGSVRSMVSSKMNASIATTTTGELRLGDRVIVSSSRGSKAGILQYVGETDFAPGVWAGVELDDPLGKNDGSVDGKRYFECSARFGLFAPIGKVSKSPSNRRPGSCAVHNNGRATPMRRSSSRDSLTSLSTSIASSRAPFRLPSSQRVSGPRASSTPVSAKNALQEILREKQQHLERLMKERELERSEVAKVSLVAERAHTALAQANKDKAQVSAQCENLKVELDKLNKQLEDERQKVDDLMFRTEEENINRDDYNKYKDAMEQEKADREKIIQDLEAAVVLQTARAEANAETLRALEDRRSAESVANAEELAAAHTLSSELQKLLDEAYALLKEKDNEKDSIGKSMTDDLMKVKSDSEKALNEANTKLAIAQTEFETQISVLTGKLQLTESKLVSEKQNLERLSKDQSQVVIELNTKVTQLQAALDDKTQELNKVVGVGKEHEVNLNKEITKLKMELSAKILDIEQLQEAHKKHDLLFKSLQDEVAVREKEKNDKISEYESYLNEINQQNEKLKSSVSDLQLSLATKSKDYEKLLSDSGSNDKLINEYKEVIHERDKEVAHLKSEYEQLSANFNISQSKIAEEHKKEVDDCNNKIDQLTKEIENQKQILDKSKIDLETLNTQFSVNTDELKVLKEENEKLRTALTEATQNNNDLKQKLSTMELEVSDFKRKLETSIEKCNELQCAKERVETEYLNLTGQATDSNEQFNKLAQHLKDSQKEIEDQKDKYREVVNKYSRIEEELKQQLSKHQEDFSVERVQLVRSVDENLEKNKLAEVKIAELMKKETELSNLITEIKSNNDTLSTENLTLKQEIEGFKIKEQESMIEYESIRKKLEIDVERYKEEISILKAEGDSSEVKLIEKVDQLTEAQNDLNNKLEEARKHEDSLQKIVHDMTEQLNTQKTNYEKDIAELNSQFSALVEGSNVQKSEGLVLKESLSQKENDLKNLILKLEMLEVDLKSNVEIINEKERQVSQISSELAQALNIKNALEEKCNNAVTEIAALKQQYDNLSSNASIDGSLLNDQANQIESFKKETSILTQEKISIEKQYSEVYAELTQLKSSNAESNKKLQELTDENIQLQKSLDEKENSLKCHNVQSDTMKLLEDELNLIKQELSQKLVALQEKDVESAKLNGQFQTLTKENLELVQQLQKDNIELKERYTNENDHLNNTIKSLQHEVTEQEKQLLELHTTKQKLTDLQEQVAKSENDIKQLTNINEGQKSNYEDLNKQLQSQFDEYKREAKKVKHDLKLRARDSEKELEETKANVKVELENNTKLQQKIIDAEQKILELSNKLELVEVQRNNTNDSNEKLEKLTLELQAARQANAQAAATNETVLNNLRLELNNKLKDFKSKEEFISKLQAELKEQRARVEIAEREKKLLNDEIVTKKNNKDNNAVGVLGQGDTVSNKILEEKELVEGQVNFLNSVIVDMKRKNDQLMARVQALESGSTNEPTVFNGIRVPRAVAPRLFCDICDVFDAHDTEDCPQQAIEPPEPTPTHKRLPPRPYCDICEVFGHSTENCDEEETF